MNSGLKQLRCFQIHLLPRKGKYILFKYDNWDFKHPIGILNNCIGDVNNLSAFYEYQLHCKDLVKPIKEFTNAVKKANKEYGENIYTNLCKYAFNMILNQKKI